MVASKLTDDERLIRKRLAARVRQQRCRARKRQAMLQSQLKAFAGAMKGPGHVIKGGNNIPNPKPVQRYALSSGPRSVLWRNEISRNSWPPAPASAVVLANFPVRYPSFDSERTWPAALVMDSRFDSSTIERHPVYTRYQPSPPLPTPQAIAQQQFISVKQPTPRYFPTLLQLEPQAQAQPIKTQEAAAIDAILSLKSSGRKDAPANPSAFQSYPSMRIN